MHWSASWCGVSFLNVLTNKTVVLFLIPFCFGKVVIGSFSFPCAFPTPAEGLVCLLIGCAFLTFWCENSLCFDSVLLENDPSSAGVLNSAAVTVVPVLDLDPWSWCGIYLIDV